MWFLQFNVAASDQAGRKAIAVVNIQVTRDQPPVFRNIPYNKDITEFAAVDSVVYTVLAEDQDLKVRNSLIKCANNAMVFLCEKILAC